tara:strand:+ start:43167 stop:43655 length:489 start_codon:yes stop_codon:yes gene_type:complete
MTSNLRNFHQGRLKRKHKRLMFLCSIMGLLGLVFALIFLAVDENLVFFFSPSDFKEKTFSKDQRLRLGGLVESGTVKKQNDGLTIEFLVTDNKTSLPVKFIGILPDLFRENQGVVAEGYFIDGIFLADEILAKHDENYMPREVAEKLRESGNWKGGNGEILP